ncbi:MAG: lipid-A-disaccharide synthase [Pyrinomonadaceae bacterium]
MNSSRSIMIVAGEASGDAHAAKLVSAMIKACPEAPFSFFGAAGPKMRAVGVEAVVRSDELSIVGLAEIGRALPMFLRAFHDLKNAAAIRAPAAVILVDFPDFNLKLAKSLKKKGFTIIYYISPQLWAWRGYRRSAIKKYVDLLLTILPFEKEWYANRDVEHVQYVGNPLAREVYSERTREGFCADHNLDSLRPLVSLLPGSRHKEVVRILPVMLSAARLVADRDPETQFLIPAASSSARTYIDAAVAQMTGKLNLTILENETYDAIAASDAAAVTSGTATLETAILGTPLVIVYRTSTLNYRLLKPLISVEHYGLINLIAGDRVAKELIQNEFTPESLADELSRIMEPAANGAMRARLHEATEKLGNGGASDRAARAIFELLGETS